MGKKSKVRRHTYYHSTLVWHAQEIIREKTFKQGTLTKDRDFAVTHAKTMLASLPLSSKHIALMEIRTKKDYGETFTVGKKTYHDYAATDVLKIESARFKRLIYSGISPISHWPLLVPEHRWRRK